MALLSEIDNLEKLNEFVGLETWVGNGDLLNQIWEKFCHLTDHQTSFGTKRFWEAILGGKILIIYLFIYLFIHSFIHSFFQTMTTNSGQSLVRRIRADHQRIHFLLL